MKAVIGIISFLVLGGIGYFLYKRMNASDETPEDPCVKDPTGAACLLKQKEEAEKAKPKLDTSKDWCKLDPNSIQCAKINAFNDFCAKNPNSPKCSVCVTDPNGAACYAKKLEDDNNKSRCLSGFEYDGANCLYKTASGKPFSIEGLFIENGGLRYPRKSLGSCRDEDTRLWKWYDFTGPGLLLGPGKVCEIKDMINQDAEYFTHDSKFYHKPL